MQNLKDLEITKEQLKVAGTTRSLPGIWEKLENRHWQIFYGMRVWKRKDF